MCYSALLERSHEAIQKLIGDVDFSSWEQAANSVTTAKLPVDGRIYPKYLAPVIVNQDTHPKTLSAVPMIYSAYAPPYIAVEQAKRLTTYNARRDSLEKRFWHEAIHHHHGVIALKGFFEWVNVGTLIKAGVVKLEEVQEQFEVQKRTRQKNWVEKGKDLNKFKPTKTELKRVEERDIIIFFRPKSGEVMFAPVIFTANPSQPNDPKGFAIITDIPNPEIIEAGHDRMPVNLRVDFLYDWLNCKNLKESQEILDHQVKEYYFHSLG